MTSVGDLAIARQLPSSLGTSRLRALPADLAALYDHYWPPVPEFTALDNEIRGFLAAGPDRQQAALAALRGDQESHGRFLHETLAEIYAHLFGYRDGPATAAPDDELEILLQRSKIVLERELFDHWATPEPVPELDGPLTAADYLDHLSDTNPGVHHPLFDYLAEQATRTQLMRFLLCETIRNEVVDDEVALLVVGLQGMQKAVAAANLWDECGRGKLENFHTFWLRQLLESARAWQTMLDYRGGHPWFARITSNTNAALLTRPAYKQQAYGCFLVFESWVAPHFRAVLRGMDRLGMTAETAEGLRIYFAAHVKIDPRHGQELADGIRVQRPPLTPGELHQVVLGAHLAASAGARQFDRMLGYLRGD